MSITLLSGDLFDPSFGFDTIGHGVNVRGVMGAGIAAVFRDRWPSTVYEPYRRACIQGDLALGEVLPTEAEPGLFVLNLASQGPPGPHARLDAVEHSVEKALRWCQVEGREQLAIPRIGCGIGGLRWPDVHEVLEAVASWSVTELVVVTPAVR